jgi:hypothetical protein
VTLLNPTWVRWRRFQDIESRTAGHRWPTHQFQWLAPRNCGEQCTRGQTLPRRIEPDLDARVIGAVGLTRQPQRVGHHARRQFQRLAALHLEAPSLRIAARAHDEQGHDGARPAHRRIGLDDGGQPDHPAQAVLRAGPQRVLDLRAGKADAPGITLEVGGALLARAAQVDMARRRGAVGVDDPPAGRAQQGSATQLGFDAQRIGLALAPPMQAAAADGRPALQLEMQADGVGQPRGIHRHFGDAASGVVGRPCRRRCLRTPACQGAADGLRPCNGHGLRRRLDGPRRRSGDRGRDAWAGPREPRFGRHGWRAAGDQAHHATSGDVATAARGIVPGRAACNSQPWASSTVSSSMTQVAARRPARWVSGRGGGASNASDNSATNRDDS